MNPALIPFVFFFLISFFFKDRKAYFKDIYYVNLFLVALISSVYLLFKLYNIYITYSSGWLYEQLAFYNRALGPQWCIIFFAEIAFLLLPVMNFSRKIRNLQWLQWSLLGICIAYIIFGYLTYPYADSSSFGSQNGNIDIWDVDGIFTLIPDLGLDVSVPGWGSGVPVNYGIFPILCSLIVYALIASGISYLRLLPELKMKSEKDPTYDSLLEE